jgi:hypothetical protein
MLARDSFDHLTVCHLRVNIRWTRWASRRRGRWPVCVLGAAVLCERPDLFLPERLLEMGVRRA